MDQDKIETSFNTIDYYAKEALQVINTYKEIFQMYINYLDTIKNSINIILLEKEKLKKEYQENVQKEML